MQRCIRDALLHVAVKLRSYRIAGIAGIEQRGIRIEPAEPVFDLLVALHRRGELPTGALPGGYLREFTFVILFEGRTVAVGRGQIAFERRVVDAGVEVVQIPFRKIAELLFRLRFGSAFGHEFSWSGMAEGLSTLGTPTSRTGCCSVLAVFALCGNGALLGIDRPQASSSIYTPLSRPGESCAKSAQVLECAMSETVLIVDDDPVQRRLLEAMVQRFGYRSMTADGGDAALRLLLGADAPQIDCIVLDLVMPALDG